MAQVRLDWARVADADTAGYNVYRRVSTGSWPSQPLDVVPQPDVGFTPFYLDTTPLAGTTYEYRVTAFDLTGNESAASSVITAVIPAAPSIPTALTVVSGSNKATLDWANTAGATSYGIYRDGVRIGTATSSAYVDATAIGGATYGYSVTSISVWGESAPTAEVSATPTAPVTTDPEIPGVVAPVTTTVGLTFSDLIARVRNAVGDCTEAEAKGWLNDRYRQMVARSRFRMTQTTLGTTNAGQSDYAISADIVDLESLMVGGSVYNSDNPSTLWNLKAGKSRLYSHVAGIFVSDPSSTGPSQIELYPAPSTSGVDITGLVALQPSDLVDGTDEPIIPADYREALADGATAIGLAQKDEKLQEADRYETRFWDAVEKLRVKAIGRIGSGPARIRIAR